MFFDDWFAIFRIFTIGVLAYAALVVLLRIFGKRTLSKWNAFDFVVTVALGSTLASVIISKDVTLSEGFLALIVLVGLQFLITRFSVRFDWIENLVKAKPAMLFEKGEFLFEAMRRERVAEGEILMAIRSKGISAVEEVEAVVLETDGSFSVIKKSETDSSRSALRDVS